jgi:hypothetical protein
VFGIAARGLLSDAVAVDRAGSLAADIEGESMTRTFKILMTTCLGALVFTGVACQDVQTKNALTACKTELGNEQKKVIDQQAAIDAMKTQLVQAGAKIDELSKAVEAAKAAVAPEKPAEEKGKPATGKAADGKATDGKATAATKDADKAAKPAKK